MCFYSVYVYITYIYIYNIYIIFNIYNIYLYIISYIYISKFYQSFKEVNPGGNVNCSTLVVKSKVLNR